MRFRIKTITYAPAEWDNPDYFRFLPEYHDFAVQVRLFPGFWLTIKRFGDPDEDFALGEAEELLYYLRK
jgi:hypothetical protein